MGVKICHSATEEVHLSILFVKCIVLGKNKMDE